MTAERQPVEATRTLTIPADLDRLRDVRAFVRSWAGETGFHAEGTADLVQAVDEAVTNVIVHGYADRAGDVEIELIGSPESLAVRIRDNCPVFDPTRVPTPDTSLPLETRRLGGMGVHLMRELSDALRHRARPGGGNELTIVVATRRDRR